MLQLKHRLALIVKNGDIKAAPVPEILTQKPANDSLSLFCSKSNRLAVHVSQGIFIAAFKTKHLGKFKFLQNTNSGLRHQAIGKCFPLTQTANIRHDTLLIPG